MEIIIAKYAGICFGVKRALDMASKAAEDYGKVFTFGPLIHNAAEVERLQKKNIIPVQNLQEVVQFPLLIRTHGVGPNVFEQAKDMGLALIDTTCPFVQKAQRLAADLTAEGYQVIIVGDRKHPEVEGIFNWTNNKAWIIEKADEVASLPEAAKVGVIAQTTQTPANLACIVVELEKKYTDLQVYNTICHTTMDRQAEALCLAQQVDMMIVIGGENSANTQKLVKICQESGVPTYHVEGKDQLNPAMFYNVSKVSVCAGASTPDWIIKEVVEKMTEIDKVVNSEETIEEKVEEKTAAETTGSLAEDGADEKIPETSKEEVTATQEEAKEQSFEDVYNQGIKETRRGSRVTGTIVQVHDNEILVDIGGKSEGVVPSSELLAEEAENIHEYFKVGDTMEVLVLRKEKKEEYQVLSKKRIDQELAWEKLAKIKEADKPVEGKIVEVVRGGLLAEVSGVRGFIPASLVSTGFVEDLSGFVGQKMRMKIKECDRSHNKLVLSPKDILLLEAKEKREKTWADLAEGQIKEGVVRRLTNFGAFVDIGGVDGLLHVSEMAWYRVNHPSDLLKEGDVISVSILAVDKENNKISLGLKQLLPNPWSEVLEKYPEESIISTRVMRTTPFGAFVQVEPGVEGLVHISQLSRERVGKTEDVVKPGDVVDVKVLSIDVPNKRMSLSIKETLPEPEKPAEPEKASEPTAENLAVDETLQNLNEMPEQGKIDFALYEGLSDFVAAESIGEKAEDKVEDPALEEKKEEAE